MFVPLLLISSIALKSAVSGRVGLGWYKWHCWGCTTIIFPCIFRSFFKNETTTKGLSTFPRIENGIYPDASKWTTEDVVQFFTYIGFKDQSEAFREQVKIPIKRFVKIKEGEYIVGN